MADKLTTTEIAELDHILATVAPEKVIAYIEQLNPAWKNDLPPWKLVRPGEKIPWQAVYGIKPQPALTPVALAWAERRIAELRANGDVP